MALSLAWDKVAVKVTSVEEFSSILSELSAKVTEGGSSLSVMVIVEAVEIELVALVGEVLGVTIMVSLASSVVSLTPVNVMVPVVEPAAIVTSGFITIFWTRWLLWSTTYR